MGVWRRATSINTTPGCRAACRAAAVRPGPGYRPAAARMRQPVALAQQARPDPPEAVTRPLGRSIRTQHSAGPRWPHQVKPGVGARARFALGVVACTARCGQSVANLHSLQPVHGNRSARSSPVGQRCQRWVGEAALKAPAAVVLQPAPEPPPSPDGRAARPGGPWRCATVEAMAPRPRISGATQKQADESR